MEIITKQKLRQVLNESGFFPKPLSMPAVDAMIQPPTSAQTRNNRAFAHVEMDTKEHAKNFLEYLRSVYSRSLFRVHTPYPKIIIVRVYLRDPKPDEEA